MASATRVPSPKGNHATELPKLFIIEQTHAIELPNFSKQAACVTSEV